MIDRPALLLDLDLRRRDLGMSVETLAQRSGLSVRTLFRVLSGHHSNASWSHVLAIAEVLGVAVQLQSVATAEELREQQAQRKAKRLVKMVQGTSALEAQGVDGASLEAMERRTVHELLAGPNGKLWAE
jgi:transcriptional regulator with XRE-family HTH domain